MICCISDRGKKFSKLYLAHACQQILLNEESQKHMIINKNNGFFWYCWLPFGIASAPAIFQHTIKSILRGIPQVCVYLDVILVTGKTEAEHLQNPELRNFSQTSGHILYKLTQKCCFYCIFGGHTISLFEMEHVPDKLFHCMPDGQRNR